MKPSVPAALLLVILLAVSAGCTAPGKATDQPAPPPAPSGDVEPVHPPSPAAPAALGAMVEIPLTGTLVTDGALYQDQVPCDPGQEGVCDIYATEILYLEGTLTGTVVDRFRAHSRDDGSLVATGSQRFTGSVAGCGSGTMSFTYTAAGGEPNTDFPGHLNGYDNLTFVPGSTTSGLAGVMDARILETFHIDPVTYAGAGVVSGVVFCQPQLVPDLSPDHAGAREIKVDAKYTSDGFLLPDQVSCGPDNPNHCDATATLWLEFTGTLTGHIVDTVRVHSPDGSLEGDGTRTFTGTVAGCGSGTMTLLFEGATTPIGPAPDDPGYLYFVEPTMTLAPGSATTGLAGIVDVQVTNDLTFQGLGQAGLGDVGHGWGTMEGSIWCRDAPVAASAKAPRDVNVESIVSSAGSMVPDQVACDPVRPMVCELYFMQQLDVNGTMTGVIVDTYHLHINADLSATAIAQRVFTGSIEGCGSGRMDLLIDGTTPPMEPLLDSPGYLRVTEPPMNLVAGATTTGFARVVDGQINLVFDSFGMASFEGARLTGTFRC